MAMSNRRVQDALLAMTPPGEETDPFCPEPSISGGSALALELETLARDIVSTPGAGGALLAAYAEQARVLQLVAQAAARSPHAPLPAQVRLAVDSAVQATRHLESPLPATPA